MLPGSVHVPDGPCGLPGELGNPVPVLPVGRPAVPMLEVLSVPLSPPVLITSTFSVSAVTPGNSLVPNCV